MFPKRLVNLLKMRPSLVRPPARTAAGQFEVVRLGSTRSWVWLCLGLAAVVLFALPDLCYPVFRDQATFLVLGDGLLHGKLPYRDLWDIKPPGIYVVYALIAKCVGPAIWSFGFLDFLWVLAISYCIYRFSEPQVGPAAAAIAMAMNAMWHSKAGYVNALQTETFVMLFVFAAYFMAGGNGRWSGLRSYAAGLILGGAFWLKYNTLVFFLLVVLGPRLAFTSLTAVPFRQRCGAWWRSNSRRIALLTGGFVTAVSIVLLCFGLLGLWRTLWESHYKIALRYGPSMFLRVPGYWRWMLSTTVRDLGIATLLVVGLALLIAWQAGELSDLMPAIAGVIMGYACAVTQLRLPHYAFETCFPFLSIFCGYFAVKIFQGARWVAREFARRGWQAARICVWLLVANSVYWVALVGYGSLGLRYEWLREWRANHEAFYANYPAQEDVDHLDGQFLVIQYLRENSAPGDAVFVWGACPLIYYLTGLHHPTRFIRNDPLMSPWAPLAWRDEVVRGLKTSPPRFFVVARGDGEPYISFTQLDSEQYLEELPELRAFISESYECAAAFTDSVVFKRIR
jgi:hypothetical protein